MLLKQAESLHEYVHTLARVYVSLYVAAAKSAFTLLSAEQRVSRVLGLHQQQLAIIALDIKSSQRGDSMCDQTVLSTQGQVTELVLATSHWGLVITGVGQLY